MRNPRVFQALPTAIFIDYGDVFTALRARAGRVHPDALIIDAVEALSNLLQRQMNAQIVALNAYADFAALDAPRDLPRDLLAVGVRCIPTSESVQRNAGELELTLDAAALLAGRPDLRRVVIVTGERLYSPLVRRVKESGRQVVLVSVEGLRQPRALLLDEQDRMLSLFELVPEAGQGEARSEVRPPRRNVAYETVTDEGALRALEIIEEFFGQYEEVYLTPLLRKLSDEFDDETIDPKTVISDLEEAGAVYLEKRRGYPHDYTVLLVDGQHPDVDRIRQLFEDYDEEPYPVDGYENDGADYAPRADDEFESAA